MWASDLASTLVSAQTLQSGASMVPDQTAGQYYAAVLTVVAVAIGLLIFYYRTGYSGLPKRQQRTKARVLGQLFGRSPATLRIPEGDDPATYRETIRALFDGSEDGNNTVIDDRPTLRAAAGTVFHELERSAWGEYVPATARRLVHLAWLLGAFGLVAVSTDWIVAAIRDDGGLGGPDANLFALAETLTADVVAAGLDLVGGFPFADLLYAVALSVGMRTLDWLYPRWYLMVVLLLVGAGLLVWLQHRSQFDDLERDLRSFQSDIVVETASVVVIVWAAGVIPAGLGAVAGIDLIGATVGFVLAVVVFAYNLWRGARALNYRIRAVSMLDWGDQYMENAAWFYAFVRYLWAGLAALFAVFLPLYAGVLLLDGKLVRVVEAYLHTSLLHKVVIAAVVLAPFGALAMQAREAWPDVRTALAEAGARQQVKFAILARGLPYLVVPVGYALFYGFVGDGSLGSILLAFVLAALAAYLVRKGFELVMRARHRAVSLVDPDRVRPASRVLIHGYRLSDPDNEPIYYVVLNGDTGLAFRDRERAVEATIDATRELFEDGTIEPSLASWFASDLRDYGIDDPEETEQRVREKIRETVVDELRSNGRVVSRDALEAELEAFPPDYRRERLAELEARLILSRDRETVHLERDPWAS